MTDPRLDPVARRLFDLDVEHGNESGEYDTLGPETLGTYREDAAAILLAVDAVPYAPSPGLAAAIGHRGVGESASHRDAVAGRIARLRLSPSVSAAVWRDVTRYVASYPVTLTVALDAVLKAAGIDEADAEQDAPRDGTDR